MNFHVVSIQKSNEKYVYNLRNMDDEKKGILCVTTDISQLFDVNTVYAILVSPDVCYGRSTYSFIGVVTKQTPNSSEIASGNTHWMLPTDMNVKLKPGRVAVLNLSIH